MKTKGIRIPYKLGPTTWIKLPDILKEIRNGDSFKWSILNLEGMGKMEGMSIQTLEKEIDDSPNGLLLNWVALNELMTKLPQIIDMVLIGSKAELDLKRYASDQEMYEACDIVIVMFDSSYWEVFSKEESLIQRFASKFKGIKFLESDFQKEYEE